ncbi:MAG: ADP-forming succinate--CoA ligase subunit beta [Candidatus Mycalebacterium zealandia]|nr:MAG: ADP-forming succinate--CoA ligase subunit beta [Candidatus Mycalebacterium zealandia]
MNLHEYQSKELLGKYGVPVPAGKVAATAKEAVEHAKSLKFDKFVVKAQVLAGGRGKAGGIKIAETPEEVEKISSEMLGMTLVTHQTGPEGKVVRKVLIEEPADIKHEFYLAIVSDRSNEKDVVMASSEGGVEIEEVAEKTPEKIIKEFIDPAIGIQPFQCRRIAFGIGLTGKAVNKAVAFISALYRLYTENDCAIAEINPLILTGEGELRALDCKVNIDDNALYRRKALEEMRDVSDENPLDVEAREVGISFVKMEGNIGCLVNGAGLAMATMDIIKYYGGEPANFLDVGGGATTEQVTKAFKMILSDKNVKSVLVNIFGGIMKCDVIAEGIIAAAKEVGINVPLVVRLEGTNVELGRKMLSESGLDITTAADMKEAAEKAVKSISG